MPCFVPLIFSILPALDPGVRWLPGALRDSPGAADHDDAGDPPLSAEDLDAAGGDSPLLRYFFDGKVFHRNLLRPGNPLLRRHYSRKNE